MRIIDSFPFDGELDLLAYRLEETFDLVDVFVLVEAAQTYRGGPKPFTYASNAGRFAWAASKFRHVKLASLGPAASTPRAREAVQRDAFMAAIPDGEEDDIVLLLDVDEIMSRALLAKLRAEGLDRPRRLAMTRHYGYADRIAPRSPCCPSPADPFPAAAPWSKPGGWSRLEPCWYGHSGVATPLSALDEITAYALRATLPTHGALAEAGRHYSSVDPSTALERKLSRVSHPEYDGARETSADHLARCRRYGVHHRGWWFSERPHGPLPEDLERLVLRYPAMRSPEDRPALARRLVRSWAWLRLWKGLPSGLVTGLDRKLGRLAPLLAPPLLLCDLGRACLAGLARLGGIRLARVGPIEHL